MTTQATGTVIDGQLPLDQPLPLPNQSRVTVLVQSAVEVPTDWQERMTQGLAAVERLKAAYPIGSNGLHFSRDELHERS
jgi:hypothetical protein